MQNNLSKAIKRKKDHLKVATSDAFQVGNPGFDRFRFIHNALPEIDFEDIDTSTVFLSKKIGCPFFISCMTGGVKEGERLNKNLALAANRYNIPMGVGSQRIAIEHPELSRLFKVRKYAPNIPVMANIGLVQLNYGFGENELKRCIDMIQADALVFHINPVQEVLQPEGNKNFKKLLSKLEIAVHKLKVPVIIKEVGFGLSKDVIRRLYNVGVRIFDTAGWGGTNWALVEGQRSDANRKLCKLFANWGIPTVETILMANKFKKELKLKSKPPITVLGSGGIKSGIDIAKSLCLGADMAGIGSLLANAAMVSDEEVDRFIERTALELKVAMFATGAKDISSLKSKRLIKNEDYAPSS